MTCWTLFLYLPRDEMAGFGVGERQLDGRFRLEIAITVQGEWRILEKLANAGDDRFRHRPVHKWFDRPLLFFRAL